jgi:hypothetical protein
MRSELCGFISDDVEDWTPLLYDVVTIHHHHHLALQPYVSLGLLCYSPPLVNVVTTGKQKLTYPTCLLPPSWRFKKFCTVNMKTESSFETPVINYSSTRYHTFEHLSLNTAELSVIKYTAFQYSPTGCLVWKMVISAVIIVLHCNGVSL